MSWLPTVLLGLAALCAERGTKVYRRRGVARRIEGFGRTEVVGAGDRARSTVRDRVVSPPDWAPWVTIAAVAGFALRGVWLMAAAAGGVRMVCAYRSRSTAARTAGRRDGQLADAVRAVASSLRAGMSTPQAVAYAEGESIPPLRSSLEAMNRSLALGEPFDDALDHWSRDVGSDDARLVAGVLRLHRRSGGDLPAVLDQVASTLRERQAATREVRALTAQARLSGIILGVLPLGFFAFLWLTSREQIQGAFNSPAGLAAVSLGLVLEILAFAWIRQLLEVR